MTEDRPHKRHEQGKADHADDTPKQDSKCLKRQIPTEYFGKKVVDHLQQAFAFRRQRIRVCTAVVAEFEIRAIRVIDVGR